MPCVVQAAAASSSSKALHYLWLDINRQHSFWFQLGVQPSDAPTAVALSPKKMRQGSLGAAGFTASGLKEFAEKLISGKLSTHPLQVNYLTHHDLTLDRTIYLNVAVC